ncbi:MAG TPA: UDP-N-acetylmuramoyl-L-alanine--D-glutamate ligase [Patescibacteria group bacterium]|nr:UDP-N-acetylmuramoyl-L-alanine--D-glutamate ligase [Patescibacteria group bacterium]
MKVAILGYGIEGRVSAKYWANLGNEITICDKNPDTEVPAEFKKHLGPDHMKNLEAYDLIVRTSGLHPKLIIENNPDHPEIMERVTTSLNEFLKVCPTKNIIGITGTKGKGTASTLVAKILEAAGLTTHLGGNIGIAPLKLLEEVKPDDWVVLELSSFQLFDLKKSVPTAVCLMIAPEHLNWHADMDEYVLAKANLFKLQEPSGRAIFNRLSPLSASIVQNSPAKKESYEVSLKGSLLSSKTGAYVEDGQICYEGAQIMSTDEVAMPGRHNLENICAAITTCWPIIDGDISAIKKAVMGFKGLSHHLEFVAETNGIKYYDDSYSTMPDATIAALEAIPEPKVLILGGGSKGLSLDEMIKAVTKSNVKHVVLMGSLANELRQKLTTAGFNNFSLSPNDMLGIVAEAKKHTQSGDVVLLSPGLPAKGDGFFIDNVDRGNQFKQVVTSLTA